MVTSFIRNAPRPGVGVLPVPPGVVIAKSNGTILNPAKLRFKSYIKAGTSIDMHFVLDSGTNTQAAHTFATAVTAEEAATEYAAFISNIDNLASTVEGVYIICTPELLATTVTITEAEVI